MLWKLRDAIDLILVLEILKTVNLSTVFTAYNSLMTGLVTASSNGCTYAEMPN